jgi:hypothetical protein
MPFAALSPLSNLEPCFRARVGGMCILAAHLASTLDSWWAASIGSRNL